MVVILEFHKGSAEVFDKVDEAKCALEPIVVSTGKQSSIFPSAFTSIIADALSSTLRLFLPLFSPEKKKLSFNC